MQAASKADQPTHLDDGLLVARVAEHASLVLAAKQLGCSHANGFQAPCST